MLAIDVLLSPLGPLTIAARDGRLCLLRFGDAVDRADQLTGRWYPGEPRQHRPLGDLRATISRYFAGETTRIDDVAVEMNGTAFQKRVWLALRCIPAGSTMSYGEVARRIGSPSAVRAVGTANGANPVALVVPCHRVIGADGTLTGYGGGLERKQWLLAHEGTAPHRLW